MSEWQPISTAPTDESDVLLSADGRVYLGFRHDGPGHPKWWVNGGQITVYATHWMPLPPPPEAAP